MRLIVARVRSRKTASWSSCGLDRSWRAARRLGEAHPDTGASYNNVAFNLNAQKRYPEAEPFFRKSLEIRIAALGEAHPDTGQSYNNVAANLHAQGRYAEAEPLFEQAIAISETTLSAN